MLKIKYPKDLVSLHQDYIDLFKKHFGSPAFTAFKTQPAFYLCGMYLEEILTADFETLLGMRDILLGLKEEQGYVKQVKRFFNYKKLQPVIASFFMKHSQTLQLSTCFYCNIDHIYAFHDAGILRNHFTLDHLIGKEEVPLFALSLHNLVPCCSSCNSKFKGKAPLFDKDGIGYLSPSSGAHSFEKDVRFRLLYRQNGSIDIKDEKDFDLSFEVARNATEFHRFIGLFKLNGRYVFHKRTALELTQKKKKYSDAHIREMAKLVHIPEEKVREDIFGSDLFHGDCSSRPLSKLRRDVAKDIGITGSIK